MYTIWKSKLDFLVLDKLVTWKHRTIRKWCWATETWMLVAGWAVRKITVIFIDFKQM